ncbi:MAG: fibronectin-binding domain-containing protein [Deltaproteobacteria bacterium]|nr:fibronectin-binding domain-containing protein [Deltaproteobacteria bacterium]
MDYLSLRAAVTQAAPRLSGKRVSGVRRTATGEVLLAFGARRHLLLSIRADRPGLFLPPMGFEAKGPGGPFSELLAARINGAALASMSLPEKGDRIVRMEFSAGWPKKRGETFILVLEVMGRHSNLILLDSDERILGSLKQVPVARSRVRPVLPGHRWVPPPARDGSAIEEISAEKLIKNPYPGVRELLELVRGLSPVTARLAVSRAARGGSEELSTVLREISEQSTGESGCLALQGDRWNLFPFQLADEEAELIRLFTSFPEAAWEWKGMAGPDEGSTDPKPVENMADHLKNEAEKILRKLAILEDEEDRCRRYGESRLKAESILINLSRIPRGASQVTLPYPSDENSSIEIELDPSITARANADRLFSRAKRLKRGLEAIKKKRADMESALKNIEEARQAFYNGNVEPAEELLKRIRPPETGGRAGRKKPGSGKSGKPPGRRYWKDGFTILVGKSAADNERVTFEAASPHDVWLHARDYPSSHVVILTERRRPPEEVIVAAGRLAAAKSGAKKDSTVEIMVTERKWVRKVKGGRPGQVTVERFRSIRVKPGG